MQNTKSATVCCKAIGHLVMIGKIPVVATPSTNVVIKNGQKQFWFYHNHKPMLARQFQTGWKA